MCRLPDSGGLSTRKSPLPPALPVRRRPDRRMSAGLSLRKASDLLRSKAVSPVELTRACLTRIEQYNATLNAFITVVPEQALAAARDIEAGAAAGKVARTAPRRADRPQRQHRHVGRANDRRERALQGSCPDRRRRSRAPTQAGGRDPPREAESARVRVRRQLDGRPSSARCTIRGGSIASTGGSSGGPAVAVSPISVTPRSAPTRRARCECRPRTAASSD